MLTNSPDRFGLIAVLLHWLIAAGVIAEFALGLYMTGLDYYDPMSQMLPHIHESVGILLAVAILLRIVWALVSTRPIPGSGVGRVELVASRLAQWTMQLLMVAVVVFGYLLSTAEGAGIPVFDWFTVPATVSLGMDEQEDICLFLHYWLAWTLIGLACVHALGALKHHFVDRDKTLLSMLGRKSTHDR